MKFSEYVVVSRPLSVMDPLGFLGPFSALQDMLFRQFTVLSNHPAYHGVLALIYEVLGERGIAPGDKDFDRAFRELEIVWGLANVAVESSVLNVTKYRMLSEQSDEYCVRNIRKGHEVYLRLAYGTLGHYTSPSVFWSLLSKSGQQLTALGERLGASFGARGGISFGNVLKTWARGDTVRREELAYYGAHFSLAGSPDRQERAIWGKVIRQYCDNHPHTEPLWRNPLAAEELVSFMQNAAHYRYYFPSLRDRYPSLADELTLLEQFERMAGIIQFVFEREYLLCQDMTDFATGPARFEEQLAGELCRTAAVFVSAAPNTDTKGLFATLAGLKGYQEVAAAVVAHHVRHQRSKDASPFIEDGNLLIRERYNRHEFFSLREALGALSDPEARCLQLQYGARRDWHFGRASRYAQYAEALP